MRGYTRAVPAQQIASNLAYINWTVLTGLAVGAYAIALLARWRTSATPGFVRFTTICALLFGVLAWFSDGSLPATLGDSPVVANPAFDAPRRAALAAFVLIGAMDLFVLRSRPVGRYAGLAALAAGLLVLVFGALSWGSGSTVGLLFQLAFLAASIGGVFAAMILGHWYLVTPKLPEAPLVLVSRLLLGVLAVQVGLFAFWTATGAGPADVAPFAALERIVGVLRLDAPDHRPDLPADRVVGGGPDGAFPLHGIRHRTAVHQRRNGRCRDDPRGGPLLRCRPAGLSERGRAFRTPLARAAHASGRTATV